MKAVYKYFLLILLGINTNDFILGQIHYIGQRDFEISPQDEIITDWYYPKLQLDNDTLYIPTSFGIYRKNLTQNSVCERFAFNGTPIVEFVKDGDNILAISKIRDKRTDNQLIYSMDAGKTSQVCNLFDGINNHCRRIVQNPDNKNSILLLNTHFGIIQSYDFGNNWKILKPEGLQWYVSFHPLDTTAIFYSGETPDLTGMIYKSYDNGTDWTEYRYANSDNSVHHIAFHPIDPDILVFSGEGLIGKSTDKGSSWNTVDLRETGMYFYKVLFDESNPNVLYASGTHSTGSGNNESIYVYRSTDTGDSWHLAYREKLAVDCGGVIDMVKYKSKLIFYTRAGGLYELDLETTPPLANEVIKTKQDITIIHHSSSGDIRFDSTLRINAVDVIDAAGKVVKRISFSEFDRSFNVSQLYGGIYFLRFDADNKFITKKISIK